MLRKILLSTTMVIVSWVGTLCPAQTDTVYINLQQAIVLASQKSVDAAVVANEYLASYWQYRTFRAELLPEVIFTGRLPYYSKSFNQYQNEDGSYTFVSNDYSKLDAGLSISQNVPWTGGKLTVSSSTEQLKQYGDNSYTNWKTIPFTITFEQAVLGFNSLGWKQKIEPVRKRESELKLIADMEETSNTTISYYFNLLLGKVNMEIAQQNHGNIKKLYDIAEARMKIGQLSENELLQLNISLLNAESTLVNAQTALQARMFELSSFLGFPEQITLEVSVPDAIAQNFGTLNYNEVLQLAMQNSDFTQNIKRRMLEADRDVSQAKANRWNISLFASFGRIGYSDSFKNSIDSKYTYNNQIIEVGVKVPLLDWGKRKGEIRVAESNQRVLNSKIQKEQRDFNQQIFLTVKHFNNQSKLLQVALAADSIAQKRYNTSIEAFVLGKMDVLQLNDAQLAKDEARRSYILQLFDAWSYHYQIRALTLHDFVHTKDISINYEVYLNTN